MPFALNQQFGIGVSRRVCEVYSAAAAGTWNAFCIGREGSSFVVADANIGATLFPVTAFAPNPAGFSPFGDFVGFVPNTIWYTFSQGGPGPNAPLTATVAQLEGIVQAWVIAAGVVNAIVCVPQPDGAEVWLFVLPQELTLLRKNPFFP
jgi:hypothetical protein